VRVFLDTNVLLSAIATRGLCADILRTTTAEHELVLAEVVLQELARVLVRKLRMSEAEAQRNVSEFRHYPVQPLPTVLPAIAVRDPDDLRVLASALEGGAEVLVTGDKDLLSIADQVSALTIVDPRTFWSMHLDASERSG
jgi:putative PIN family toxin of toxin-antitoxin system